MPTFADRRPATVWALTILTIIQIIGASAGGIGLVQDPVGNIGMPLSMLKGSPFNDYLYPGIILLVVVGLFPIIPLVGLVMRRTWGWWLELVAGCGLIIWISTEVVLLGYLPGMGIALQIVMGLLGIVILVLTLSRPTRQYFRIGGA